jgi:hypothetical protein
VWRVRVEGVVSKQCYVDENSILPLVNWLNSATTTDKSTILSKRRCLGTLYFFYECRAGFAIVCPRR